MQGEEKKTTEHTERRRKDTEKELDRASDSSHFFSVSFRLLSVCSVVFFSSPHELQMQDTSSIGGEGDVQ
jgi:hypothetical protein